jgi:hypothetical protein
MGMGRRKKGHVCASIPKKNRSLFCFGAIRSREHVHRPSPEQSAARFDTQCTTTRKLPTQIEIARLLGAVKVRGRFVSPN